MPECPGPLLGGNILQKVGAQLIFGNSLSNIIILLSDKEISISEKPNWLDLVNPEVWATEIPRRAKYSPPVKIQLKGPSHYPHQRKYPWKPEAKEGLWPLIN